MKRVHFIKCAVAAMLLSIFNNVGASAQFYTVDFNNVGYTQQSSSELALPSFAQHFVSQTSDTSSLSADPYDGPFADAKVEIEIPASKSLQEKSKKSGEKSFVSPQKRSANLPEISLSDTTDSLVLELIKKRLTVCMPLDLMRVNSRYGYRKDPFKKMPKVP